MTALPLAGCPSEACTQRSCLQSPQKSLTSPPWYKFLHLLVRPILPGAAVATACRRGQEANWFDLLSRRFHSHWKSRYLLASCHLKHMKKNHKAHSRTPAVALIILQWFDQLLPTLDFRCQRDCSYVTHKAQPFRQPADFPGR